METGIDLQVSFGTNSFADNPMQRCACILLADTSYSMTGQPIEALNEGIRVFREELLSDSLAAKSVELALVTFGPVSVDSNFVSPESFEPPLLKATGDTPMGAAIEKGIELLNGRKKEYREHGVPYTRPWIFLITDGEPNDDWEKAAALIKEGEEKKSFAFFAVGVDGANFDTLRELSKRPPAKLKGLKFREMFVWLSGSLSGASRTAPGGAVNLAPIDGWAGSLDV